MRRLGISIYPEKSNIEDIYKYIDKVKDINFTRIFSCLISFDGNKEDVVKKFKDINSYAKKRGFEIILDISPKIFGKLGISYKDLSFFKEIEADGIRLDAGYTGSEEALMTFNDCGLKIEINMSNNTHYIDTIMDYKPNKYKLIGCHNFYPHRYSGLSLEHFNNCTRNFNKYGLKTACFVTSQSKNAYGPWKALEGLPTLEMHRELDIDTQIKHIIALSNIDDIIISNCYPTDEELDKIKKINMEMVSFDININKDLPKMERDIIFDEMHFNRGDISENMIRSTAPRVKYKGHTFNVFNTPKIIKKGDVIIESSEYGHYAGELQIALNDMENSGKSNVVGRISDNEIFILDYIKPWQKFVFNKG